MFDKDKWIEIGHVLLKNPFRTLLTSIGVIWGIFILILSLGVGKGFENGMMQGFSGSATNSLFLWTQGTSMAYKGYKQGRYFNLKNQDVDILLENIPEIEVISPRCQFGGYGGDGTISYNTRVGSYSIYGDCPQYLQIEHLNITKGRFINNADLANKAKVVVIGNSVYTDLFEPTEEPVGKYIIISGVNYLVVGVYKTKKAGEAGYEDAKSVYVPMTTFQQAFNWGDKIGWFSITAKEGTPVSTVEEKVIKKLKEVHSVHPDDSRAFGHWNMEKMVNQMTSVTTGFSIFFWFAGILILMAGSISVTNIMLIVVKERTREIGVRRALGATSGSIITQILSESMVLTIMSGLVGFVLGMLLLAAINAILGPVPKEDVPFIAPKININVAVIGFSILTFFGVLAGFLPAFRAISIRPIEALRDE